MSDAINNFSDAGNSLLTIFSFILGNKKADSEHPFGHGRYEYIMSLIIGIIIVMVGIEFMITSVKKAISPEPLDFSIAMIIVLALSIVIKIFMGFFYLSKNSKIKSQAIKASMLDSFFDCLITLVVLISLIIERYINVKIDAYAGMFVSLVIIFGGGKNILETMNRLLGKDCGQDTKDKIVQMIMCSSYVIGCHDLMVHDYGPNVSIGSVDVEFEEDLTISNAHTIISDLEKQVYEEFNIILVIHPEYVDGKNKDVNELRSLIKQITFIYGTCAVDAIEIDDERKTINFSVDIKEEFANKRNELKELLLNKVLQKYPDFVIEVKIKTV